MATLARRTPRSVQASLKTTRRLATGHTPEHEGTTGHAGAQSCHLGRTRGNRSRVEKAKPLAVHVFAWADGQDY